MVNTQVRLTYQDYLEIPDDASVEIYDSGVLSTALIPGLHVELADVFAQD